MIPRGFRSFVSRIQANKLGVLFSLGRTYSIRQHLATMALSNEQTTSPLLSFPSTKLLFHAAEHQQTYKSESTLVSVLPVAKLPEEDRTLYKGDATSLYVLITTSTIFHPQGGGQPSDVGTVALASSPETAIFNVDSARTSASNPGLVLHFGTFQGEAGASIESGSVLIQTVDEKTRHLYSRLHTAGHVLGTATRTLLEDKIEGFDELKASHFPDSAGCEFKGVIEGKWKSDIQQSVDDLVDKDAEVRIEWWTKSGFRERKLERLLPSDEVWHAIGIYVDQDGHDVPSEDVIDDEKTRIRVVNIVGSEVYPCGGTHVPTTKACGKVTVRKIGRQKGISRISYKVD